MVHISVLTLALIKNNLSQLELRFLLQQTKWPGNKNSNFEITKYLAFCEQVTAKSFPRRSPRLRAQFLAMHTVEISKRGLFQAAPDPELLELVECFQVVWLLHQEFQAEDFREEQVLKVKQSVKQIRFDVLQNRQVGINLCYLLEDLAVSRELLWRANQPATTASPEQKVSWQLQREVRRPTSI